jgi:hypothetical protein
MKKIFKKRKINMESVAKRIVEEIMTEKFHRQK